MKPLLGGKGANLHEMTRIGLPVPPLDDVTIPRGDGCVCCPAFTGACRGLEQEWWNEWEWEELENHVAASRTPDRRA